MSTPPSPQDPRPDGAMSEVRDAPGGPLEGESVVSEEFAGWLDMSPVAQRYYTECAQMIAHLQHVRATMRQVYARPAVFLPLDPTTDV